MICESPGKRRPRPYVIESPQQREVLSGDLRVTHESISDVSTRSAKRRIGSVETNRHSSKQFEQKRPDLDIHRQTNGKLDEEDTSAIYQQYRCGVPVETLAQRHRRTKTNIHRVIHEMRVRRIVELPLDFIPNPQFSRADEENAILTEMPTSDVEAKKTQLPSGVPPYLASLYEVSLLSREQEGHLFRKFNYLKYKASMLRSQLDPAHAKQSVMDQIERLYEAAVAVKNQIVQANLRLVVSIAKRYAGPRDSFFELVSDGNISLMRAIEKFDFARGNKISTYASWAIMRNFARTIPNEQRHRDRFRTSHEEMFNTSEEHRSDQQQQESGQGQREAQVRKILERLDEREQQIIVSRFGLEHDHEPRTLEEIGLKLIRGDLSMHPTKNDIPSEKRAAAAELLNELLANLIDLQLQAKQAHWNVKGSNFIALHELFDTIAEEAEEFVDTVAERIAALGGRAEGTIGVVGQRSKLASYPLEIICERDHLEALSKALATVGKAVRGAIGQATELGDADTADLFTEVSRGIDKKLWFVESHLQGDR